MSFRHQRLERLLKYIRCPNAGTQLHLHWPDKLISENGEKWDIINGVPILYKNIGSVVDHGNHVSNPICKEAQNIIDSEDGLILNLAAGGSKEQFEYVVELETGIFKNTDIVADVHSLPFIDETFSAVIALNAFEHFANPFQAAAEIFRVLKPGGKLFIHTAFLQPLHEAPYHFFNASKHGILQWFNCFDTQSIRVSDNFNPIFTLSWIAHELLLGVEMNSSDLKDSIDKKTISQLAEYWRDPSVRSRPEWNGFKNIPQIVQEKICAGFEYIGIKNPHSDS